EDRRRRGHRLRDHRAPEGRDSPHQRQRPLPRAPRRPVHPPTARARSARWPPGVLMSDLVVVEEFSAFLETAGIASSNLDAAPAADIATIWQNPRDGAPAPRDLAAGGYEFATITLS